MRARGSHRSRTVGSLSQIVRWPSKPVLGIGVVLAIVAVALVAAAVAGEPGGSTVGTGRVTADPDRPSGGRIDLPGQAPGSTSPPPSSPSAAASSPPSSAAGVAATSAVTSSWDDGFIERVTLANRSGRTQSWIVVVVFPAGTTVVNAWNANVRRSGQTFEFTATDRMGPLKAGGSLSFGFEAAGTGAAGQTCTVNGRPCG